MKLTADNVHRIAKDCLFTNEETKDKTEDELIAMATVVEGPVRNFGFSPKSLKRNKDNIKELLSQLPDTFMKNKGGGHSFIAACVDKDGAHWGEHRDMETLFCLGEAVGFVECQMPREMWSSLPGGMPYYLVQL